MSIISISQSIGESAPEANTLSPAAKQRQLVMRAFTGTMAVGLVLTTLYLGTRIVTSRNNVHAAVRAATPVPPKLVKAPEAAVNPTQPRMPEVQAKQQGWVSAPVRRNVTPKPGEKYIQIAAFGPKALESYLRDLEGKGLHPVIAPGPSDGIYRILIGPYTNIETLEQTRRTLQVVGMDSIVRVY
jgi:hypothetical protein